MSTGNGLAPQSQGDRIPYNQIFRTPIRIKQAPQPHTIQLCVHPDWTPSGDMTTIHIHQSKVLLSNDTVTDEHNVTLEHDVADLRDACDRSKQSHESGISASIRHDSPDHQSIPTASLAPNVNLPSATNIWKAENLVSAVVIIFLMIFPYISHPAWILPTILTSTTNFTIPLTEDISHVHTTFRKTVVPFRSRWEIDDLLKVTPWSVFYTLHLELDDVETGLDAWGEASIPGPDPELRDQIRELQRSIPVRRHSDSGPWKPFTSACARVVEDTVRDSAARIFNASTPAKNHNMISIYCTARVAIMRT